MSDAANLDKHGREPGTGLAPGKKEARGDRGTGSDASAALAALGGGPGLQPAICLLYTSPSPRDGLLSRMPSSA